MRKGPEGPLTLKTVTDLTRAFVKKYRLQYGHGGTPLVAPFGPFSLSPQVRESLEVERFTFKKCLTDGRLAVTDPSGKIVRKFSARHEPELWVWPSVHVDYKERSVVCLLRIRSGCGETFPAILNDSLCQAISSTYPDCHFLIQDAGQSVVASEPWNNLGFGNLWALSEVFADFARGHEVLHALARAGFGLFKPNPTPNAFVEEAHLEWVISDWSTQLENHKSEIGCVTVGLQT
ncbi:MAG: hypothetical protein Q8P21_01020 [bacterium]|nr:hypothetical protein [bacterium]